MLISSIRFIFLLPFYLSANARAVPAFEYAIAMEEIFPLLPLLNLKRRA